MAIEIQMKLNEKLYKRDPQDTKLGRRIIEESINLIDELGFEKFTFKKLADRIESTEASIYRYFENKHLLLVYLVSWYWEWVSYQINVGTNNMTDPVEQMKVIIDTIVDSSQTNPMVSFVDESALNRIIVAESTKAYHTKDVDSENKEGFFKNYKILCGHIVEVILKIQPGYPYPRTLASTMLEMANHQLFFAQHLPRLTDLQDEKQVLNETKVMLRHFAFKLLDVPD